jgi:hypothetical protein
VARPRDRVLRGGSSSLGMWGGTRLLWEGWGAERSV